MKNDTADNPYASPKLENRKLENRLYDTHYVRVARFVFFIIDFVAGQIVFLWSFVTIIAAAFGRRNPTDLLGGIILFVPALLFSASEWLAYYRQKRLLERRLGIVMLGLAVLGVFGLIANVGEIVVFSKDISTEFVMWFFGVGASLCAYFGTCGIFRLLTTRSNIP